MGQQLQAELDVVGGDRHTITPPQIWSQVVCPLTVVGRMLPALGKPPFQLAVLVISDEREED
jgi:hypothetical protein